MVGRGAQGRPWFPGHLAHYLATGERKAPPALRDQLALVSSLYEEMLSHYGVAVGLRHARKHLGWALDVASAVVDAPSPVLKAHRESVLTATDPKVVKQRLAQAFDDLEGMSLAA
jgi:tRNA-dihydrouridine synthase